MQKSLSCFLSFAAIFILSACSQVALQHGAGETPSAQQSGADDFSDRATPTTAAPAPESTQEKKVAIILGPGGYKTFAHAGVLKELKKANVPIQKIVGVEWGALVAGLFAQRGQIHEAEWKLYKLEKLDLDGAGFFSRRREAKTLNLLGAFLKENLEGKDVAQAAVPFFCPSLSLSTGALSWQDKGTMASVVSGCLAFPPLFLAENDQVAALFSYESTIARLKNEGFNVIILVNVLGDGILFDKSEVNDDYAGAVLWNEARRAIWQAKPLVTDVIEVTTRGIKLTDFSSRKLLVTAGEAAGEKAARQLLSKYGF